MKRLYKRLLAVVLCLALTAAIVPATAFALEELPGRFASGRLDLKLYESCSGDLAELLPEIDIKFRIDQKKQDAEERGMYFTIYLSENTCDAVTEAIAALDGNPLVEYARPFYYYVDGIITIRFYNAYDGDVAALFPDVEIERVVESTEGSRRALEEQGKAFPDRLKARMNKEFRITLVDKSADALLEALENMQNCGCELIESISPQIFTFVPGEFCTAGFGEDVVVDTPVDDKFTVSDALAVLRVAAGLAEATPEAIAEYDKDGDGKVTVADALIVLRIAAKLA